MDCVQRNDSPCQHPEAPTTPTILPVHCGCLRPVTKLCGSSVCFLPFPSDWMEWVVTILVSSYQPSIQYGQLGDVAFRRTDGIILLDSNFCLFFSLWLPKPSLPCLTSTSEFESKYVEVFCIMFSVFFRGLFFSGWKCSLNNIKTIMGHKNPNRILQPNYFSIKALHSLAPGFICEQNYRQSPRSWPKIRAPNM